jgi:hypothetical protein
MVGIRVAPDENDVVVWKFDDASAPFVNSSTSTNALPHNISDLSTLSGTVYLQQPSPFAPYGTNSCVVFSGNNSGSPRNFISGANNVELQYPVTFSCWVYLRTYYYTGFTQHYFSKQHTAGVWSGVFAQICLQNRTYTGQSTAFDLFMLPTVSGGALVLDANNNIPLNQWVHVGITYDGSTVNGYLNGNIIGSVTTSGNINYGNHGPWFFGSIPSGSGNPEEGQYAIADFRIANIARPQSYFQNIYRQAMLQSTASVTPINTYYKLRAYDMTCSTPTAVYWISKNIDYSDAPPAPCGALSSLEVLETLQIREL